MAVLLVSTGVVLLLGALLDDGLFVSIEDVVSGLLAIDVQSFKLVGNEELPTSLVLLLGDFESVAFDCGVGDELGL